MELVFDDFKRMEEIDKQYFPENNITPAEEAYKIYLCDHNTHVAVKKDGMVVAYITILSLKKEIYEGVKHNLINESEITVGDLEPPFTRCNNEKNEKRKNNKYFNYLYFSSIAIDKNYRTLEVLKNLIDSAKKLIYKVLESGGGDRILEVMADCATDEGTKLTQQFLKLQPFMKTSHGSTIHILNGDLFLKNFKLLKL